MKKRLAIKVGTVPLIQVNNFCMENGLELDTKKMEIVLLEVEENG